MAIIAGKRQLESYFDTEYLCGKDKDYEKHMENHFKVWSHDLCLGEEVYITSQETPIILDECHPYVNIKPGEFALLITYERLKLPTDVMAFISVKFTYKKKGLINISGFHVDPNYAGRIIFSVYNAGPSDIMLKYKEPIFMIFFEQINHLCDKRDCEGCKYYNKCQVSRGGGYENIPTAMISEIKGQSITLANNHQKIERLEHSMKLYGGIAIAIITTLLGVILSRVL